MFVYVAFDVKLSLGYLYILKHLSYFIAMKTYWKEVFCAPLVKIFRIHFFESFFTTGSLTAAITVLPS